MVQAAYARSWSDTTYLRDWSFPAPKLAWLVQQRRM